MRALLLQFILIVNGPLHRSPPVAKLQYCATKTNVDIPLVADRLGMGPAVSLEECPEFVGRHFCGLQDRGQKPWRNVAPCVHRNGYGPTILVLKSHVRPALTVYSKPDVLQYAHKSIRAHLWKFRHSEDVQLGCDGNRFESRFIGIAHRNFKALFATIFDA